MKFTPKLLLTTFICATGAQLTHCSQAQSSSAVITQAAPSAGSQEQARLAQAAVQAAVAQLQRTSTQAATQTTGQAIAERDPKRPKISPKEEINSGSWLSQYAEKMTSQEQKKLENAKIRAVKKNRTTILPHILYDLLTCMPQELITMIAAYDKPYTVKGELDHPLKINLPKDTTITAVTSPLLPHGTTIIIGFSNGYLQIYKENNESQDDWVLPPNPCDNDYHEKCKVLAKGLIAAGFTMKTKAFLDNSGSHSCAKEYLYVYNENNEKNAKKHWELQQAVSAHSTAIIQMVSLKDKMFATSSQDGTIKVWGLNDKQQYELKKTIPTNVEIQKLIAMPNGKIALFGPKVNAPQEELECYLSIWDPILGECIYWDDTDLNDFSLLSDGTITLFRTDGEINLVKTLDNKKWEETGSIGIQFTCSEHDFCTLSDDRIVSVATLGTSASALVIYENDPNNLMIVNGKVLMLNDDECTIEKITPLQNGAFAWSVSGTDEGPYWLMRRPDKGDDNNEVINLHRADCFEIKRKHLKIQQLLQLPDGRLVVAYNDGIEIYN
jgi:WD40 repeat protein